MNRRRAIRLLVAAGVPCILFACHKADEVAHTTPTQNAAMRNLDAIAKAPVKGPETSQATPSARR
jgi:hypothetical protein